MPAMLLSAIGDGMSVVAVAWLALRIAPADQAGVWTALAVAAYTLPATFGAAVLARLVRGLAGAPPVSLDGKPRGGAPGAVRAPPSAGAVAPPPATPSPAPRWRASGAASGIGALRGTRRLTGVLVVTCVFFFLYGPVEVALPIHIAREIHGSAALLGTFWATFGIGAIV